MYKKIILAIDDSETSKFALQEAIKIAKEQSAFLHVVHVVEEIFPFHGGAGFDYSPFIAEYKKQGKQILREAEKFIKENNLNYYEMQLLQLNPFQGRIAEVIIEKAKKIAADLLVIGKHGKRGFSHFFLGSVADNVIHIANLPVLLVPHQDAT